MTLLGHFTIFLIDKEDKVSHNQSSTSKGMTITGNVLLGQMHIHLLIRTTDNDNNS